MTYKEILRDLHDLLGHPKNMTYLDLWKAVYPDIVLKNQKYGYWKDKKALTRKIHNEEVLARWKQQSKSIK